MCCIFLHLSDSTKNRVEFGYSVGERCTKYFSCNKGITCYQILMTHRQTINHWNVSWHLFPVTSNMKYSIIICFKWKLVFCSNIILFSLL